MPAMLIITAGLSQRSSEVVHEEVVAVALEMAGGDGVALDTRAHDCSIKNTVTGLTLVDIKLLKQCIVH